MNVKICSNIVKFRKENNMTQAHVAEYLGVSPQAVSKWEQESAVPDVYLIPKIAFLFNVTIDALFGTSNLDTTDLLVSKYSTIRNDRNYKEAKDAVDSILDINSDDLKALGLLSHLEYQRALEYLDKSREGCERLYKASTGKDENWQKRSKMQLMRLDSMLGNYSFIDKSYKDFEADKTVENLNYLLVALGENHQYEESLVLGKKHVELFNVEEQRKIYPNLMEIAYVLEDVGYAKLCFDKIIDNNKEHSQVFNAWWLLWKLNKKLGNVKETEFYRSEVLKLLPLQNFNKYNHEMLLNHIEDEGDKPPTFL